MLNEFGLIGSDGGGMTSDIAASRVLRSGEVLSEIAFRSFLTFVELHLTLCKLVSEAWNTETWLANEIELNYM